MSDVLIASSLLQGKPPANLTSPAKKVPPATPCLALKQVHGRLV